MLEIGLGYLLLGVLLVFYSLWRYYKLRKAHFKYLAVSFGFLTSSVLFMLFSFTWWIYVLPLGIAPRFLELAGLALFALFTITTILALKETQKTEPGRTSP